MEKRIDYIDYLKGLSVIWVVWYHTEHPAFVDYSFRIPLFFFVSGIFFKAYPWNVFWRKKINQLVIPFVLFYLLYYFFLIFLNYLKFKTFNAFDYSSFWGIFQLYSGYESFVINPPLWFICALFNLNLILYLMIRIIKDNRIILFVSFLLSLFGIIYIKDLSTYFMFGRSVPFLIYYVIGYIFGKSLLNHLDSNREEFKILLISLILFSFIGIVKYFLHIKLLWIELLNYFQIISLVLLLIVLFKHIYIFSLCYPFKYFGVNSYIVLGMHEIYHTSFRIIIENTLGSMSIALGILQTLLTLFLLWPTIYLFNKYIPSLVAKKDMIIVPKL